MAYGESPYRRVGRGNVRGNVGSISFTELQPHRGAPPSPIAPEWGGSEDARRRLEKGGEGYGAFRDYALSAPGQTPWQQMMMGRQGIEEAGARDMAARQSAGMGQNIWNQLAMRGGAGAGARERAAQMGKRAGFGALQNVGQQGRLARADIGLRGEEQRLGMLGHLPGMELQRTMGEAGLRQQDYENLLRKYEIDKKAWSAERQAEDIASRHD